MPSVTDEDLALRASSDILALCPRDQTVASGTDGVFTSDDRWTLLSPSTSFDANGVCSGQLVELTRPTVAFGPAGLVLVVQDAGPGGVVLRRKGQPNRTGAPPGPIVGALGVEFAIRTLAPQISRATSELRDRFGLTAGYQGAVSSEFRDDPALREAIILTVLYRQFLDMSRQFARSQDQPDDWYAAKSRAYKRELDDRLSELTIRDKSRGSSCPGRPRLGARISR